MNSTAAIIAAAQLTKYIAFNTAELTDCNWTDKVQGRAANKVTMFSIADYIAPS